MANTNIKERFVGTWHLKSWEISYSDSDNLTLPFGDEPQGKIIYTNDGWMSASISRKNRSLFPSQQSIRALPAESLADAYTSYFHYAGLFHVVDDVVIHSVKMSLNPNFVGTEQRRHYEFYDDHLCLSGEEKINQQTRHHKLIWCRTRS